MSKIKGLVILLVLFNGCKSSPTVVEKEKGSISKAPYYTDLLMDKDWVRCMAPTTKSLQMRCGQYSRQQWKVIFSQDNLVIEPYSWGDTKPDSLPFEIIPDVKQGINGEPHVLQVKDGWLVGFDAGEFGGGLWWFSPDGNSRKRLVNENVVGFAKISGEILVLVGLNHLSYTFGQVIHVIDNGTSNFKTEVLADFGTTPRTFIAEPDFVLILTEQQLVRINKALAVEKVLDINYRGLYPNSMVASNTGIVYVGMRHFVTCFIPKNNGYEEQWFVPANCLNFELDDRDCTCKGQ